MAAALGGDIRMQAAVLRVEQHGDGVRVAGEFTGAAGNDRPVVAGRAFSVSAARVIVAIPPVLAGRIRYAPALDGLRDLLIGTLGRGALGELIDAQGYAPMTVLIIILALYVVFGCIMDSLSMIVLTIPIFFPIVTAMDFGMSPEHFAIWFGILVLMVAEIGMITPPVGLNLFIISAMARDVPIRETYKGIVPFVTADLFRIVLLTAFPIISIFLV